MSEISSTQCMAGTISWCRVVEEYENIGGMIWWGRGFLLWERNWPWWVITGVHSSQVVVDKCFVGQSGSKNINVKGSMMERWLWWATRWATKQFDGWQIVEVNIYQDVWLMECTIWQKNTCTGSSSSRLECLCLELPVYWHDRVVVWWKHCMKWGDECWDVLQNVHNAFCMTDTEIHRRVRARFGKGWCNHGNPWIFTLTDGVGVCEIQDLFAF